MKTLGIALFRNGQEISVTSLKSDIRDVLRSDLEEQLIQHYDYDTNTGKEHKSTVKYVAGKRMFQLSYDETQDPGGAAIRRFEFDELEDHLGIYKGKTYTAEISSQFEGGRRRRKTRRSKKRSTQTRKNFFLMKKYR